MRNTLLVWLKCESIQDVSTRALRTFTQSEKSMALVDHQHRGKARRVPARGRRATSRGRPARGERTSLRTSHQQRTTSRWTSHHQRPTSQRRTSRRTSHQQRPTSQRRTSPRKSHEPEEEPGAGAARDQRCGIKRKEKTSTR